MTQSEFLADVIARLESLRLPYMVVGSVVSNAYGLPRFTHDIDIVLELSAAEVEAFCQAFAREDYYLSSAAVVAGVARRQQFNLIHAASGNKVDFMPARTDAWGREQLTRRRRVQLLVDPSGNVVEAYTASPEDVILGKLWYFSIGESDKHLTDIAHICQMASTVLDTDYIERWATDLSLLPHWQAVQERLRTPPPPPPVIP